MVCDIALTEGVLLGAARREGTGNLDIGGPQIFVADEVIDGYRTLHADYTGLHWNGEQYISYCRRDCTRG